MTGDRAVIERHAHAGSGIHNHLHRTTADGRGGRLHAHRYTARGAWVGCDCDHCQMLRARAADPCDPEPEYLTRLRARYLELRPDEAPAVVERQEPEWVRRARAHALPPKDTAY